jgi:NAD(P)-dependent dehydrogenase (short-subunit alcohol dehydrogenase family)
MIAIITGGSRGIGSSIVKSLLLKNYVCIIASRHNNDTILALAEEFAGKVDFFPCNIADDNQRKSLVEYAVKKYGQVDLLVNCAGVAPKVRKDMLDITEEDFDFVMDINLKGTYFVTQEIAKQMAKQCSGRIINISSMSSYTASVSRAEYCISKAGISMITKLFTSRLAEYGVGVFEIAPGIIETEMTKAVKGKYETLINDGLTPIKRMGQPEDIAKCVEAIADGKLDFCTGNVINADGGFSVRRL